MKLKEDIAYIDQNLNYQGNITAGLLGTEARSSGEKFFQVCLVLGLM